MQNLTSNCDSVASHHLLSQHPAKDTREIIKRLVKIFWKQIGLLTTGNGVLSFVISMENYFHKWLMNILRTANLFWLTNLNSLNIIMSFLIYISKLLLYLPAINYDYCKTSNISRTLVSNKIVDNSDVVGASPVGAAQTTSSFST